MNFVEQAYADYLKLKQGIGFKREPALVNLDGGMSFMGFLCFASGESEGANEMQRGFEVENGTFHGTRQAAADYIDWLIVNVWGEEEPISLQEAGHA